MALLQLHILLALHQQASNLSLYLHEIALYPIAPLLYLYLQTLLGQPPAPQRALIHLAPTGFTLVLIAAQILTPEWQGPLKHAIYTGSFLSGSAYAFVMLQQLQRLSHPAQLMRLEGRLLMGIGLCGVAVALLALAGGLLDMPQFSMAYGSGISALLVLGHFIHLRYPEIGQIIADELQDASASLAGDAPRRSQLNGIDRAASLAEVERLMREEHLYRRYDMTLPLMADAAGLSPHQLSELINQQLGINFSRYLKQHRIAEARELLLSHPERSALDVGLAVGFPSLSSFYAAFREFEGMAPGQFRKQKLTH